MDVVFPAYAKEVEPTDVVCLAYVRDESMDVVCLAYAKEVEPMVVVFLACDLVYQTTTMAGSMDVDSFEVVGWMKTTAAVSMGAGLFEVVGSWTTDSDQFDSIDSVSLGEFESLVFAL